MDVDRHCDVSSSRTKTLEGYASRDLFLAEERKKWSRSYVLSLEQDKEKNLDRSSQLYLISTRSFSYEQFLISRYNVSHPSTRFLKLNSSSTNGGGSLEIGQKWKFAEGFIDTLPLNRPPVLAERYARIIWW